MNIVLLITALYYGKVCMAQYYLKDQTVGCDGVIGSGVKLDRCGVCGGNSNTCKIISGIFTKKVSTAKYEYITDFPIGAMNINITEGQNTRNYLALRYTQSQASVINANWTLDWSGEYKAAGTLVEYSRPRHHSTGENIFIKGPINEQLQLLLLAQTKNPGIFYEYILPIRREGGFLPHSGLSSNPSSQYDGDAESLPKYVGDSLGYDPWTALQSLTKYQWKIVEASQCSQTCGEGYKDAKVVCMLVKSQVSVTDDNCEGLVRPDETKIPCRLPACSPDWEVGDWTTCSSTCGSGTQSRVVECKRKISERQSVSVYAMSCNSSTKPSTVKMCNIKDCFNWDTGNWLECSAKCGSGTKSRKVKCSDSNGSEVDDSLCALEKPRDQEKCYSTCDQAWFYGEWTNSCSQDCATGNQTRQVYCPADDYTHFGTNKLSKCGAKPTTVQECDKTDGCQQRGQWYSGEWSQCLGDCNEAYQTRDVVCMTKRGQWSVVTYPDMCSAKKKPEVKQKCRPSECDRTESSWFVTDWSECSVTCGDGYNRREVKCLDGNMQPSENCQEILKPQLAKPCTKSECPIETKAPPAVADPSCRDKYSSCRVVVQARLCKLDYYKLLCCSSCSNDN